jgi:hypothetical protein
MTPRRRSRSSIAATVRALPRPAARMPTEGPVPAPLRVPAGRLASRRIRWGRARWQHELVVHCPTDPARSARVRLVLDVLPRCDSLACDAPSKLHKLDGERVARRGQGTLSSRSGARVTLAWPYRCDDLALRWRATTSCCARRSLHFALGEVRWQGHPRSVKQHARGSDASCYRRAAPRQPLSTGACAGSVFPSKRSSADFRGPRRARAPLPISSPRNRWTARRREETRLARSLRATLRRTRPRDASSVLPGELLRRARGGRHDRIEATDERANQLRYSAAPLLAPCRLWSRRDHDAAPHDALDGGYWPVVVGHSGPRATSSSRGAPHSLPVWVMALDTC